MVRAREQPRARIVGDGDGQRASFLRGLQHRAGERGPPARRQRDQHIRRRPSVPRHRRARRFFAILRPLDRAGQRLGPARHQIDQPRRVPAKRRHQLDPVLHRDPPRCARARIDQPARTFAQALSRRLRRRRDFAGSWLSSDATAPRCPSHIAATASASGRVAISAWLRIDGFGRHGRALAKKSKTPNPVRPEVD